VKKKLPYQKQFTEILLNWIPELGEYGNEKIRNAARLIRQNYTHPWHRRHRFDNNLLSFSRKELRNLFKSKDQQIRDLIMDRKMGYQPPTYDKNTGELIRKGTTAGYQFKPQIYKAVWEFQDTVIQDNNLLNADTYNPNTQRKGVASLDINGTSAKLGIDGPTCLEVNAQLLKKGFFYVRELVESRWGGSARLKPPADVDKIFQKNGINPDQLDTGELLQIQHQAFQMLLAIRNIKDGVGILPIQGRETTSGRITYSGVNPQNCRKVIRHLMLNGMDYWEYDISNAHPTFLHNFILLNNQSLDLGDDDILRPVILGYYNNDPERMRKDMLHRHGISPKQAKGLLLSKAYGAPMNSYYKCSARQIIGSKSRTEGVLNDNWIQSYNRVMKKAQDLAVDSLEESANHQQLINVVGKSRWKSDASKRQKVAHALQGYEALYLKTAYDLFAGQVSLYMHDGIITRGSIDMDEVKKEFRRRSGFRRIKITEEPIQYAQCGVLHIYDTPQDKFDVIFGRNSAA